MKLIISTHFFFLSKIVKAFLLIKCHAKGLTSSNFISRGSGGYLKDNYQMQQVHGRPNHPQTQGKIERYHRTMKNVVKLDNYFAPEELEAALERFVYRYNNQRYHESLNNLTPADVYFGRGELILKERERLKKMAIINRRNEYQKSKLTTNQKNLLSLNY